MKRMLLAALMINVIFLGTEVFAVEKVPKKSKKDTTKIKQQDEKTSKEPSNKQTFKKSDKPQSERFIIRKDKFIDRDGDGINDAIKKHKAPEVKKERIPKVRVKKPEKIDDNKDSQKKTTKRKSKK